MDKHNDPEAWLNLRQAAWATNLSRAQFDGVIRPRIKGDSVRKDGRNVLLSAQAVIGAMLEYRLEQRDAASGGDPLMVGADSPSLERYRAAKASLTELELDRQNKTHISLSDLDGMLHQFASCLRRGGETLQRRFGNEASEIYNESIDDAKAVVRRELNAEQQ